MTKEIIYLGDPMCSWCWGFSPTLESIRLAAKDKADVTLVLGGLRAGETRPLSKELKETIQHHWEQVHTTTGQPFKFSFFERDDFVYNTEPPSRAVVTMRHLHPELAFPYMEALHRAFYAEARDVTEASVQVSVASQFAIDEKEFANLLPGSQMRKATQEDFGKAFTWGVRGFPTVLLRRDQHYMALTMGYQSFDILEGPLKAWLNDEM